MNLQLPFGDAGPLGLLSLVLKAWLPLSPKNVITKIVQLSISLVNFLLTVSYTVIKQSSILILKNIWKNKWQIFFLPFICLFIVTLIMFIKKKVAFTIFMQGLGQTLSSH